MHVFALLFAGGCLLVLAMLNGPDARSPPASARATGALITEPPLPDLDARARLVRPLELVRWKRAHRVLLFDVRDPAEYAVSHIAGARRLDPAADRKAFVAEVGAAGPGSVIVLYCTAMGRSQWFADSVLHDLASVGAGPPHVLTGGLVGWSNAYLPLVSAHGLTRRLHGFNGETARWLIDPSKAHF
jgi:rhodanese-related sulfurtransferase